MWYSEALHELISVLHLKRDIRVDVIGNLAARILANRVASRRR